MSHRPRAPERLFVARPSYLARRGDGRYFLQIRLSVLLQEFLRPAGRNASTR